MTSANRVSLLACLALSHAALAQEQVQPDQVAKVLVAESPEAGALSAGETFEKPLIAAPRVAGLEAAGPALEWIPLPHSGIPFELDSGPCDGYGEAPAVFLEQQITMPGWRWMRVFFAECHLGERSYVRLTALEDGDEQILDAAALRSWRGASAFFNGDALVVELVVHPADRGVFLKLAGVTGGAHQSWWLPPQPATLCGNDDRVASSDARVCRVALWNGDPNFDPNPICTGWQVSNGAVLTAGHCVDFDPDGSGPMVPDGVVEATFLTGVVQFNVPLSDCDGSVNHPSAADQYPIDAVSAFSFFGEGMSVGRDWAVFSILPNGSDYAHVSRGWFRMTNELPANGATVRVTGFGVDSTPAGCDPNFVGNAQNQTNQTNTGAFNGEQSNQNAIQLNYAVDTMPANSGSPVIWEASNITIGVHTAGGCTPSGGSNAGTSFELDALENAIANFVGPNPRFVDNAYPMNVTRDGTVFKPWTSFSQGINGVPAGGVLTITPGAYGGGALTINKAMTIRAPGGTVTITQ